jgi:rhodanese-related sulfurtransferase
MRSGGFVIAAGALAAVFVAQPSVAASDWPDSIDQYAKVDLNRKIYVQCASGSRATLAAKQLKDIGFTNVTAVVMDLAAWQKKGHPFVTDEAK